MRTLLTALLFLFVFYNVNGQRPRRIILDADTASVVGTGTYGIYVRENQPYLRNSYGVDFKLATEFPYEICWSSGNELTVDSYSNFYIETPGLETDSIEVISDWLHVLRDSVLVNLHTTGVVGFIQRPFKLTYYGWHENQPFVTDSTSRINFTNTILWVDPADGATYGSAYMSHDHPVEGFRIKTQQTIQFIWNDGYEVQLLDY